jgi:8-oxo-dGTP pyrophosphatase MutT (NUDIX family)
MSIVAQDISFITKRYLMRFPDEGRSLRPLLLAINEGGDLISRNNFQGHITCGVVLIDPCWRVLHIEHKALGRWLMPGGHVEPRDGSLVDAALRELYEETGIVAGALTPAFRPDVVPLDIDVHVIPDNPVRNEPSHQHFDFRHAFRGPSELGRLQEVEVAGARWLHLDAMSPGRLTQKLRELQGSVADASS